MARFASSCRRSHRRPAAAPASAEAAALRAPKTPCTPIGASVRCLCWNVAHSHTRRHSQARRVATTAPAPNDAVHAHRLGLFFPVSDRVSRLGLVVNDSKPTASNPLHPILSSLRYSELSTLLHTSSIPLHRILEGSRGHLRIFLRQEFELSDELEASAMPLVAVPCH
ncbi:uncharacterized protein LOC112269429 [Brachypodium distachyon]|uniref:Uncharacterized protein n=1 Tax=Brachypodium distachyon TaxID=15368 RepID=A0A0Q3P1W3_BRADI|nr:uncharacterized protein LOC112269429 [Brachypodium distachyon]KQJ82665.1 hypothetical protein BRADI_5g10348v3 [Brachypodium distachyon]|eukprot:XP_024311923.1 uncharacterized protein LOC112269429 [Brachypodium distachyon]